MSFIIPPKGIYVPGDSFDPTPGLPSSIRARRIRDRVRSSRGRVSPAQPQFQSELLQQSFSSRAEMEAAEKQFLQHQRQQRLQQIREAQADARIQPTAREELMQMSFPRPQTRTGRFIEGIETREGFIQTRAEEDLLRQRREFEGLSDDELFRRAGREGTGISGMSTPEGAEFRFAFDVEGSQRRARQDFADLPVRRRLRLTAQEMGVGFGQLVFLDAPRFAPGFGGVIEPGTPTGMTGFRTESRGEAARILADKPVGVPGMTGRLLIPGTLAARGVAGIPGTIRATRGMTASEKLGEFALRSSPISPRQRVWTPDVRDVRGVVIETPATVRGGRGTRQDFIGTDPTFDTRGSGLSPIRIRTTQFTDESGRITATTGRIQTPIAELRGGRLQFGTRENRFVGVQTGQEVGTATLFPGVRDLRVGTDFGRGATGQARIRMTEERIQFPGRGSVRFDVDRPGTARLFPRLAGARRDFDDSFVIGAGRREAIFGTRRTEFGFVREPVGFRFTPNFRAIGFRVSRPTSRDSSGFVRMTRPTQQVQAEQLGQFTFAGATTILRPTQPPIRPSSPLRLERPSQRSDFVQTQRFVPMQTNVQAQPQIQRDSMTFLSSPTTRTSGRQRTRTRAAIAPITRQDVGITQIPRTSPIQRIGARGRMTPRAIGRMTPGTPITPTIKIPTTRTPPGTPIPPFQFQLPGMTDFSTARTLPATQPLREIPSFEAIAFGVRRRRRRGEGRGITGLGFLPVEPGFTLQPRRRRRRRR